MEVRIIEAQLYYYTVLLDELKKVVPKGETAACSNVPYKAPRGHKNNWGENDWTNF